MYPFNHGAGDPRVFGTPQYVYAAFTSRRPTPLSAEWLAGVKRNAIEIERSEAVRLITNAATTKARHQSAVASCTLLTATHHIMRVTGKGSKRDQEETDAVIKRDSKRVLKMCLIYDAGGCSCASAAVTCDCCSAC
jgi:hypothetical protein